MTESSSNSSEYFQILEEPYNNKTPCLPDKEMIIKIPQNLPQGTLYNIGFQNEEDKISVGDKLNIINQKLNNMVEIDSLLLLKQIPDILYNLNQIKELVETIIKTLEVKKKPLLIKPPITWY